MKTKICIVLFSLLIILTSCQESTSIIEEIQYEKQLEVLKSKNIVFKCVDELQEYYVEGVAIDELYYSFKVNIEGCYDKSIYLNFDKQIFYTVIDENIGEHITTNELIFDRKIYDFYKEYGVRIGREYRDFGVDESVVIYEDAEQVLTFLAMLDILNQEDEKIVYDKSSLYWEELYNYYTFTMRGLVKNPDTKDDLCALEKLTVIKQGDNKFKISADSRNCPSEDGLNIDDRDEITVTIGVEDEEFINTYNELVSLVEQD